MLAGVWVEPYGRSSMFVLCLLHFKITYVYLIFVCTVLLPYVLPAKELAEMDKSLTTIKMDMVKDKKDSVSLSMRL